MFLLNATQTTLATILLLLPGWQIQELQVAPENGFDFAFKEPKPVKISKVNPKEALVKAWLPSEPL
jgi:hypothetical protein